jgi:RNA polymerase sigma-70 factor (ECF subfamily)
MGQATAGQVVLSPASQRSRHRGFVRDADDAELAAALKTGHPAAPAVLVDRYGRHVERVVTSVLGHSDEVSDVAQEVFIHALDGIGSLRDDSRLKAWLTRITVVRALRQIRSRKRRRWLLLGNPEVLDHRDDAPFDEADRDALRATYRVLDKLSAEQRVAFGLRFIQGLELTQVAEAMDVSLATIKRRLNRAEKRFVLFAGREPALQSWLAQGSRWRQR